MKTPAKKKVEPTRTMGVRLSHDEWFLIESASLIDVKLGDRGGVSAWARRVLLAEAHKFVEKVELQVKR